MKKKLQSIFATLLGMLCAVLMGIVTIAPTSVKADAETLDFSDYVQVTKNCTITYGGEASFTWTISGTADAAYFEISASTIQNFIALGNETMGFCFVNDAARPLTEDTWKQVQYHSDSTCIEKGVCIPGNELNAPVTKTVTLADYKDTGIYFYTDKSTACNLIFTISLENRGYLPSEYFVEGTDATIAYDANSSTYTVSSTTAVGDGWAYFEMPAKVVQYFISCGNETMDIYFKNSESTSSGTTWKQVHYHNNLETIDSDSSVHVIAQDIYAGVTKTVILADYKDTGIYFGTDRSTACNLLIQITLFEGAPEFDGTKFAMLDGGSVRLKAPTGLGFTTRIDKAAYDDLAAKVGEENITLGTLILPTDYLTGDFTMAALNESSVAYKNIVNSGWKNADTAAKDGYYEFRGSLAPVQEHNYDRAFSARAYMQYTYRGETILVYTDYTAENNSRSIADVAQMAYEDVYKKGPEKSNWLTPTSTADSTVTYTADKGWKVTANNTSVANYNFQITQEVMAYYISQGMTTLKITFGNSFDSTNHAGTPVNCQKWILAKNAKTEADVWTYNQDFISLLPYNGDGTYTATADLTDTTYNFVNFDLQICVNTNDVENNVVGACYIYGVEFSGATEKSAADYPYALEKDDYTYSVDGLYSPYTAAERAILCGYILPDDTVVSEDVTETEYVIVKSASAGATESKAADLLATYLNNATGRTFSVISDAQVNGFSGFSKYISVGQTSLLEGVGYGSEAEKRVSGDGYIWKTRGNMLFIDGISERGTLYGVMDFAEEYLGYVFIDSKCTENGSITSLKLSKVKEKQFTPYIETRTYLEYDVCQSYTEPATAIARKNNNYYLKNMDGYGGCNDFGYYGTNSAHTMLATLEKGIELDGGTKNIGDYACYYEVNGAGHYQPCLTKPATIELMANAMKTLIKEKYASGIRYYVLTQEDSEETSGYCTCEKCKEARTTYGGQSGVTLHFMNEIVRILDGDSAFVAACPDYKLYTYAYQYSKAYPTVANSEIKANQRVAVMLCITPEDASHHLLDETNNPTSADLLNGWKKYCDELMVWFYDTNFTNYLDYRPTLTRVIADNVYYLKQLGVKYIMVQGAYNTDGIWDDKIRAYVYSELLYDFDETEYTKDADAYVQTIVTKYLKAYYGDYAKTVQGVITYFQNAYKDKAITHNESLATNLKTKELKSQLSTIQAAREEASEELKNRLYAVEAGILGTLYECDKPWVDKWWSYKSTFTDACSNAGIKQWAETQTIEDKF